MLILQGHTDAVRCLSYSPDGRYLASGSEDDTARLWDLAADGQLLESLPHPTSIEALLFTADGKDLLTGTSEGALFRWDSEEWGPDENVIEGHAGGVRCMAREGQTLVTAGWDRTVKKWDVVSLATPVFLQQDLACTSLALTPDGNIIAAGHENGTVHLYQRGTAKLDAVVERKLPVSALAWSPDGRLLASGHADGSVLLREDAKSPIALRGHDWIIYALAFTPDGRTLISGSADGTVRLWDVFAARERRCYRWHSRWVTCVAVAPDGMTAAAGSGDHTVVVWDLDE